MDTNIDNYTTDDLLTILDLDDEPNQHEILESTNELITKYETIDQNISNFFIDVQNKLMDDLFPSNYPPPNEEDPPARNVWYENEQIPQSNPTQAAKITDRNQQVGFFNTPSGTVMNQNQLGINNSVNIPVAQGNINPNLKNTTVRIVNIDSSFRTNINDPTTNFSCSLSDPLTNVIQLELYSVQIPLNWYVISAANGTNCFLLMIDENSYYMQVNSGNYEIEELLEAINNLSINNDSLMNSYIEFTFNKINGKVNMDFKKESVKVVFYDEIINVCGENSKSEVCPNSPKLNNSLGWYLGFREKSYSETVISEAVYNLYGTKNLYIVLDDYNQNRLNKGLVSLSENDTSISLPDYYSNDLTCAPLSETNNITQYVQSAPRRITQAQLYSLNEILKGRENRTKTFVSAPTTTDIFAVVPVEREPGSSFGFQIVAFGGSLQQNARTYFGPVNIDRIGVKLVDDYGMIVDLNLTDWNFSFTCESLYQY